MRVGMAAAMLVLGGCVVTQSRNGDFNFGFIEPGTTVAQFQTANGATRLRRHHDGKWSLRFSDKLTVYNMGAYDDVQVVKTHTTGGRSGVLLQRRRNGCTDYELLTVAGGNQVGRNAIHTGCGTRLQAAVVDDRLLVREQVDERAQFWIWGPDGVRYGREPAPQRASARPATPTRQAAPASRQAASPARAGSSANAGRASAARTPARPAPATPALRMPSGTVQTDVLTPTRVVLEKGN